MKKAIYNFDRDYEISKFYDFDVIKKLDFSEEEFFEKNKISIKQAVKNFCNSLTDYELQKVTEDDIIIVLEHLM